MFQVFSKLNIITAFYLNQDYIAKVLCIEKEVPDNECQGHCQLKKRLKEEEEKSPATNEKSEQVLLFIEDNTPCVCPQYILALFNNTQDGNTVAHSIKVYHPPRS